MTVWQNTKKISQFQLLAQCLAWVSSELLAIGSGDSLKIFDLSRSKVTSTENFPSAVKHLKCVNRILAVACGKDVTLFKLEKSLTKSNHISFGAEVAQMTFKNSLLAV